MKILNYEENEDGSANITFDIDDEYVDALMLQGIRETVKDKPVVVMSVDEYMEVKDYIKEPKQIELEPQMAQAFLEVGIVLAIEKGLENVSNSDGQTEEIS